ncbi:endonuclease MutS2 (plasmid) [Vescimonas fastidiosa]|uniref:Endonuclease MutS2 n=1 Tax=Vescimonas fastidiosa TaxID=2714353 RepID=A0A810PZZ9_9FIRM|nr:endonuclease MutS2 [Vescimonas fastidiosa]BCK79647.1 endonuclease MutS2 [Vescimonas fastidiosa]
MNTLFEKSIRTLELPVVLEMLASLAVSDAAKEKCRGLSPVCQLEEAVRLQEETQSARERLGLYGSPSFSGVKDVSRALNRADHGGVLNTRELLDVADLLTASRRVAEYDRDRQGEKTVLDHLFSALHTNKFLEDKIRGAILDEETIADSASPELADIRRKMRLAASKGRQILQRIISSPSYAKVLQEALITQRDGRFVVPVKAECKGSIPGLVHDISSSGATLFVEPMGVVQANNELKELQAREEKEIDRILRILSGECAAQMMNILYDYDILVHLDVIFARGQLSYRMNAAKPILARRGGIVLRRARHPLLDQAKAVPISLELGNSYDTLVITGPNTGGKTVTLKTIGLLTLMAQCGLQIPADDGCRLRVFDRVLADVGDEQSIEQSLSTFSAHMSNTVEILRQADENSLLLFDELGAGTDPVEGAALAIAIIQNGRSKGSLIAATTHYAEMKTFAMTTAGVENASCEFDVATLRPTYRLLIGIPGKSNAFAISRRLGLDEEVIAAAKAQMDSESIRFEDVLTQLEEKRQRLEKAQAEADRLWQQSQEDARKARTFREQMEKAKENARSKGENEARRIVRQAQQQVDEIFAELDELRRKMQQQADFQAINDAKVSARKHMNAAQEALHLREETPEPETPSRPIAAGDRVELPGVHTAATVVQVNGDGSLVLQAGKMKMTAKPGQVRLIEGQPQAKKQAAVPKAGTAPTLHLERRASSELDIRGYETLEAESVVENYLDAAVMAKLETVTIIHGKGTGALRKAVHEILKRSKAVKSFRLGRYGEGEAGVTVVELK